MSTELLLALLKIKGIGPKAVEKIIDFSKEEIRSINYLMDVLEKLSDSHKKFLISREELEKCCDEALQDIYNSEKLEIKVISRFSEEFPKSLLSIKNCPLILNVKGNVDLLSKLNGVAVIGTRNPSEFGIKIGERATELFIENGFDIVSGLALGCDTVGHETTIVKGGRTVAVLANGLDSVYPKKNEKLAHQIVDYGGILISEYSIGTKPQNNYFVERDRLQSGLSKGVCVVETGIKGGTMHTVKFALEQKRILGCINHPEPHRFYESFQGNKMLIESGKAFALGSSEEFENFIAKMRAVKFDALNNGENQLNLDFL